MLIESIPECLCNENIHDSSLLHILFKNTLTLSYSTSVQSVAAWLTRALLEYL